MERLTGLDIARYFAFVGMVIVNFSVVMGADMPTGFAGYFEHALQGRAAATFVVLAGIGLGLAARRVEQRHITRITLRRAVFLLILGLLNTLIFPADIIHYYAIYFVFAVFMLPLSTRTLVIGQIALSLAFVALLFVIDYETGWDWKTLEYTGFWTPAGFIRNLFLNGWHPVVPWLGFMLLGIVLSRLALGGRPAQNRLIILGAGLVALGEVTSGLLTRWADPELAELLGTAPVPPMPLYMLAGSGAAMLVIGLCLRGADWLTRIGVTGIVAPAGRQTLTLYIAHIFIGMGIIEELGLLGGQTAQTALVAAFLFCICATVYAWFWTQRFRRGPIEALMRRVAG